MHRIVNALPRAILKIPFSMHVSGFKYREIAEKIGITTRNSEKAVSSSPDRSYNKN